MLILFLVILSALIFVSIDILSFGLKRTGWNRFISTFLLFHAQIISTQFVLGLLGILNTTYLSFLNILISCLILFLLYKKFRGTIFTRYWSSLKNLTYQTYNKLRNDRLWLALWVVAAALIGWIIFLGIIFPAIDFDGNSYHLSFIGYAMQSQSILDAPTSLRWLNGYPKGGELIQMWSVMISNKDILVDLAQIPFLFLGIYAIYEISKKLGVDEKHARFSALLFLFIPVVLNQLKTTYIDVMLCTLFFAAIAVVIKAKLSKLDFVLLGIIFSLLISIKFTGFLFVGVAALFLLWNLYTNRNKKSRTLSADYIKPLLLISLPTLFGFYWYIKNLVIYHNFLYPFGLKVAGVTIFPGQTFQEFSAAAESTLKDLPSGCAERIWFVWTEQKDWFGCLYNYDANFTGLGPIWFIILLPAVLVALYFVFKLKNYLYLALASAILAVFATYPLNYLSRYTMFITILGFVSLGILFTHLKVKVSNTLKVVVIILALSVFATNFTLCNFTPLMVKSQLKSIKAGDRRGELYTNTIGEAYTFLQDKIQPNETVAYDSKAYFIYPLWRQDYANKVIYIPPGDDKNQWLEKLKQNNVRYLFIFKNSKEYNWLNADMTSHRIYKDSTYEIYQIY